MPAAFEKGMERAAARVSGWVRGVEVRGMGLAPEDGGDIALDGAGGDAFEAHLCDEVAEA